MNTKSQRVNSWRSHTRLPRRKKRKEKEWERERETDGPLQHRTSDPLKEENERREKGEPNSDD